jgi:sugar lactone lactonase YvrE
MGGCHGVLKICRASSRLSAALPRYRPALRRGWPMTRFEAGRETARHALLFLALTLGLSQQAFAGPKDDLEQFAVSAKAGVASLQKGDLVAADKSFTEALARAPQRPKLHYELALGAERRGQNRRALDELRRYAEMGIAGGENVDADFAALMSAPGYAAIKARMAANLAPICTCTIFSKGSPEPFIAEGIAHDAKSGRFFVGGVHARRIVAITNGHAQDFVKQLPHGYSPFGMTVDARRGLLWVTAAILPQSAGAVPGQFNRSALLAFDLATGALKKSYPATGALNLNDLALAPEGAIYVADSLNGSLLRLRPDAPSLSLFGPVGLLSSAQGMVVSPDGKRLLVADYAMGLVLIDLAKPVPVPEAVRVPANRTTIGIDGLARLDDGSFVATQNAFAHARVLHLRLSDDWSRLESLDVVAANTADVADPTLVAAVGNEAYVIGVSQWASFDDTKPLPVRPVASWRIVRLNLG